jgi:hypothetical protein
MAARVVNLGRLPAAPQPASPERGPVRRHQWHGASGRAYAHEVYSLIECPPLPASGYILVRRDGDGPCRALRVGVAESDAPTLNLASLRQGGAQAGANEVHVYLGPTATSKAERRLIACDLRAGLFGTLADIGEMEIAEA